MTRVLIVEPGYCPYQAAFDSPQAAISEVIEGDSLLLKPFGTSKIGVVCSKNQSRLKYNRQLEDGCTIRGRFGTFKRTGGALQSAAVLSAGRGYAVR